jgi:hypothetical protein
MTTMSMRRRRPGYRYHRVAGRTLVVEAQP